MNSRALKPARPPEIKPFSEAAVVGSSMSGLIAARVLTEHFERVTIVERDRMPAGPEFRKGVPQGRQPHILLKRGQNILDELFPGLSQEVLNAGAVSVNFGLDVEWFTHGGWRAHYDSKLVCNSSSRPLLESTIHRRLSKHPRVRFMEQTEVTGLCVDSSGSRAKGVQVRTGAGRQIEDVPAELVVDASGRDSRAPEWLECLGYTPPEKTTINGFPGYATRIYQRPPSFAETWKAIYIQPTPPDVKRGGAILPLEGDTWQVVMIGMGGDYPPIDEAGYLEYARTLPSLKVYEAIEGARPLTSICGYRRAENVMFHYERLPRYLENFLVFGDALCSFNPVYAQGMSVAAISGRMLDECLREHRLSHPAGDLSGLAMKAQRELAKVADGPWQMATAEDRRWSGIASGGRDSQPDPAEEMMYRYMRQVMVATLTDPEVTETFYLVMHMIEPPTLFFNPDVVLRVFATVPEPAVKGGRVAAETT